jgi:hypothetical protein
MPARVCVSKKCCDGTWTHNLHAFLAVRVDTRDVKISWVLLMSKFLNGVLHSGEKNQKDSVRTRISTTPPLHHHHGLRTQ